VRYVLATPMLRWTILLMGVVATLGLNFRVALPLLARFTYHGGPSLYGVLASMMAAGSVVGALTAASRAKPTQGLLLWSVIGFGVSSLVMAFLLDPVLAAIALLPVGFFTIAWISTANTTVQLGSAPEMRGRVMSIYGLLLLGSTPIGAMIVGWLSEAYGPRSSVLLAGLSSLIAVGIAILLRPDRQRRRRASEPAAEVAPKPIPASAGSDEAA
jgi:MFS family permease